ncbi:tetratricopeptide repeat protein [Phytohabitans kaempferiae]|uniref:Tetratricopeptide repeat protein n=1 Tax=Phytohabitans kaempferiae TaxID=1620943 RepID=A0ABV6MFE4_9ACTN
MIGGYVAGHVVQAGAIHGGVHVHQAAQPGVPVPRQLPPPPARVVGRDRELAEIDRLVRRPRDGPAIVVVTGTGGVGKSTLALAWAHRAAERYPDGQLHANLGAFDLGGPAAPGSLLAQMLRALGVAAERVPADIGEQSALFRSLAFGRDLLMVLDNAVSAAQVRPLLPPSPSCVVLVTARWRLGGLHGDGADFLAVEPLPEEPATELLVGVIGRERAARDPASIVTLVRLCAGLPIALALAAARLATRPRLPVGRMAKDLAREHQRLSGLGQEGDSVRGTFDLTYRALEPGAARCYRAIGLHPGADFGVPVVAAALDVDEYDAAELLDVLVEASVLGEERDGRFRPHDLIRLHAREIAGADPETPDTTLRMLEWYLAGVLAADRILTPYRHRDPADPFTLLGGDAVTHDGRPDALRWLEDERGNLVAAVQYAAGDRPLLAWRIADSMWPLFHLCLHRSDRMLVDRIAVECAVHLGDRDREARMVRRWAFAHFDVGRLDEAHELFERSRRLCDELGDRYGVASAVEGLGMVAAANHRYDEAVVHFGHQERLCRELGERRRTGLALLNLGAAHNALSRPEHAEAHLRRADAVFADVGDIDPYNQARVGIELARALGRLGEREQAEDRLRAALRQMREVGSPRGAATALHRLGELDLEAGDFPAARDHLTSALRTFEELADLEAGEVRRLLDLVPPAEADPHRMP